MSEVQRQVMEALVAELANEHGCIDTDDHDYVLACGACATRSVQLSARLAHEGLLATRPSQDAAGDAGRET